MIIEPKVRGFICTTAHPQGCAENVKQQIDYVKKQGSFEGPKNVLVIGASTGYGLASRIVTTFGANAKTIGVFFERPAAGKRTGSAGWYNTAAYEKIAHAEGLYAKSINGDAFSKEVKQQTADLIRADLGKIDCLVYSLASPRRTHPDTGKTYNSTLKPIGKTYTNKTVDTMTGEVSDISIDPANDDDIQNTIAVMGGEDWEMWVDFLKEQNLLTDDFTTIAYTYIGPELTYPVYTNGTIGAAKKHLHETADKMAAKYKDARSLISVNKALVTQASSAIPVVPLYMSLLFKVMKEKGTHEGCIEQMQRLFKDNLYGNQMKQDAEGRIRVDDWEMDADVQTTVDKLWNEVNTDNLESLSDLAGYREDFYKLFGFGFDNVDYTADVDANVKIDSID